MLSENFENNNCPQYYDCDEDIYKHLFQSGQDIHLGPNVSMETIEALSKHKPDNIRIVSAFKDNKLPGTDIELKDNGYEEIDLNKKYPVYKKKYKYKKGKKYYYPVSDFSNVLEHGCSYTKDIAQLIVSIYKHANVPFQRMADIVKDVKGVKLPRQEVYKLLRRHGFIEAIKDSKKLKNKMKDMQIDEGETMAIDEQYYKQDGAPHLIVRIMNPLNNVILRSAQLKEEEFTKEFLEEFIKTTIEGLNIKYAVTDGHKYYPTILEILNIKQKRCTFHSLDNLMKDLKPVFRTLNKNIKDADKVLKANLDLIEEKRTKIKETNSKYKKEEEPEKWKTKRKTLYNEIKELTTENKPYWKKKKENKAKLKKYEDTLEAIKNIFTAETLESAMLRFKRLKSRKDKIPREFDKYLVKLERYLDQALAHIENENVPNTNNAIELLHRVTNPQSKKNNFKTDEGVALRRLFDENRWTKRVVLKET